MARPADDAPQTALAARPDPVKASNTVYSASGVLDEAHLREADRRAIRS